MASSSGKRGSAKRSTGGGSRSGSKRGSSRATLRGDKSVEAFRDALERSVTLSRDRLQEVVDDAVRRGRMTRTDANELVANLVTRGRQYTDELVRDLEKLIEQARKEVETRVAAAGSRVAPARKRAEQAASRASRELRARAEPALAEADKLRRRAGVASGTPIAGYESLTAAQVKARLRDLSPAELRKVRTIEKRGKARKGILDEIERRLSKG